MTTLSQHRMSVRAAYPAVNPTATCAATSPAISFSTSLGAPLAVVLALAAALPASAEPAPRQAAPVSPPPLVLNDTQMDQVAAGAALTATSASANASAGRAFSMSSARLITNGHVTVSMARSIAVATGGNPHADSAAVAVQR